MRTAGSAKPVGAPAASEPHECRILGHGPVSAVGAVCHVTVYSAAGPTMPATTIWRSGSTLRPLIPFTKVPTEVSTGLASNDWQLSGPPGGEYVTTSDAELVGANRDGWTSCPVVGETQRCPHSLH